MGNREQRRFTISELKEFDGREGKPAYFAYMGKVYDVTESPLWKEGKHTGGHFAGRDLTENMINAPHSEEVFAEYPVVGKLIEEVAVKRQLLQMLERHHHLHPILVHFSIAYSILVPLLCILYLSVGGISLEMASYYVLILGFLSAPAAGISGFVSWKIRYEGRETRTFARKRACTIALTVVITICLVWRTLNPNVLVANTNLSYVYLALVLSLALLSTILGYDGGKIVYP